MISGLLRKKLNFDFVDNCDLSYHEDNEAEDEEEMDINSFSKKRSFSSSSHNASLPNSLEVTPNQVPSPRHTRSGRIFSNANTTEKPRLKRKKNYDRESRIPTPVFNTNQIQTVTTSTMPVENKELHLLQKDLPPPLNYVKRPMSRIQSKFEIDRDRRASAPGAGSNILAFSGDSAAKKGRRSTDINPFTPNLLDQRKKMRLTSGDSR